MTSKSFADLNPNISLHNEPPQIIKKEFLNEHKDGVSEMKPNNPLNDFVLIRSQDHFNKREKELTTKQFETLKSKLKLTSEPFGDKLLKEKNDFVLMNGQGKILWVGEYNSTQTVKYDLENDKIIDTHEHGMEHVLQYVEHRTLSICFIRDKNISVFKDKQKKKFLQLFKSKSKQEFLCLPHTLHTIGSKACNSRRQ